MNLYYTTHAHKHTQDKWKRENYSLGGEIYCFVQYCIAAIQNSVLHTISAYISHLSQMLY